MFVITCFKKYIGVGIKGIIDQGFHAIGVTQRRYRTGLAIPEQLFCLVHRCHLIVAVHFPVYTLRVDLTVSRHHHHQVFPTLFH